MKKLTTLLAIASPLLFTVACGGNSSNPTYPDGQLMIQDIIVGTGAAAAVGDTLSVTYVGTLTNGTVFDSSALHGGAPFTFVLGTGAVIAGWDQGLVGMRVGGERKLTIPPNLAYPNGQGSIPPNSTIVFDITLVSIAGK